MSDEGRLATFAEDGVPMPPLSRVRTFRLGPWTYRLEKFPSGYVLRWVTKRGTYVWRNDWC